MIPAFESRSDIRGMSLRALRSACTDQFIFFTSQNRNQPLILRDGNGNQHRVDRTGNVSINAVRSVVKAVLADQGIHNGPLWAFARLIAKGKVVVVLPEHQQEVFPLYAVRQPSPVVPARIYRIIEFISRRVKSIDGLE